MTTQSDELIERLRACARNSYEGDYSTFTVLVEAADRLQSLLGWEQEARQALDGLLACCVWRRPDGHYEFCLVPNRDVEFAKDLLAKLPTNQPLER